MPIVTLRDLYVAELQDLFDAEQQILQTLPALAAAATSSALRQAFTDHLEATRIQAERLELLLRKLDAAGNGAPCDALRGLAREARRRMTDGERGDVLDAALIGAAQRIEHYEIAAYGCARTYARILGDAEAEGLLQQTLDEEAETDARLSRIAESGINQAAGEDAAREADRQQARLRYLPARHLHEFKYREYRVKNARGEDLGSLDGLVVDSASNQPRYFVIDSHGWFAGRRYLVPVNALRPDDTSRTLRTQLNRETIRAYPPFNPDAYLAMGAEDDTRERRYDPPSWLMTGVWMTEASGFASVPPRAESDFATAREADERFEEGDPENELMRARGAPEDRGASAQPSSGESEPRIERYPER